MPKFHIVDESGYDWIFDGERVYMVEAEKICPNENGEYADSLEEALGFLVEGGYGDEFTVSLVKES